MPESNVEEMKYFERLNIPVLSISKIKELVKLDIKDTIRTWQKGRNVDKQCFHIIGPAGVGKTQICYQIAEELNDELFKKEDITFDIIKVTAPVLSRDDFIIPFPIGVDTDTPKFEMLYTDFVPRGKHTFGLFVIDEFSRGDHQLQQLLWQVQNEYAVHRKAFPKGWFVISIDNPDDSEYSMDTLEDAAGLRRQLHWYTEVQVTDFLDYAIKKDFHPFVIEFIQTHPEYIYDFQAQKIGSVYANPASYEKLSDHLWKMQISRGKIDFEEIEHKAAGLINTNMSRLFIEFAKNKKDINPKDIFYDFKKVLPKIEGYITEKNNAKLGELMRSFCTFMLTSMPKYTNKEIKNVGDFLTMMPPDTSALFITQLDSIVHASKPFIYMTKIHQELLEISTSYQKHYQNIIKLSESRYAAAS